MAATLGYFLSDAARRRETPSNAPVMASLEAVLDALADLSPVKGTFFGLVTPTATLQFYSEGDGEWSVDVPVPARRGSLQRRAPSDELERYVRAAFAGTPPADLPGLEFEAW